MQSISQHDSQKLAYFVDELQALGGPSRTTAFSEIKAGRLRARRSGRRTIILHRDLVDWFEALPEVKP